MYKKVNLEKVNLEKVNLEKVNLENGLIEVVKSMYQAVNSTKIL
jgi:uncharacterized protein YjbI with pentapeptide repeats